MPRRRFFPESLPHSAQRFWPALVAAVLLAAFFVFTRLPDVVRDETYLLYGLSSDGVRAGWVWQILTYAILHGSWMHVAVNALMLYMFLSRSLWAIGVKASFIAVAGGAVLGGIVHLLVQVFAGQQQVLVGASGGTFGLLFLVMGVSPGSRMWPIPVSARSLTKGLLAAFAIVILIDPLNGVPIFSEIGAALVRAGGAEIFVASSACHLGGAIAGLMVARWVLRPRWDLAEIKRRKAQS